MSTPGLVQIQLPSQGLQRVSRVGLEAEHSSLSSAKINNEWNATSTPPVVLHEVHRCNFKFYCLNCLRKVKCMSIYYYIVCHYSVL